MIVDCHTHWGGAAKTRDGLNPAPWLKTLAAHGVTHAIVLPLDGLLDAGKIPQDNDDLSKVCGASGGKMVPFCTVNTWFGEEALPELERCLETLSFRGIKFHPWLQGQPVNSPVMDTVCERAAAHDVPILFHDGTPPFSLPSQIALLARRHPRTKIVLGHCGLFEHWREAIAAMRYAPNLWGCMCSPHPGAIKQIIKACDHDRLLWGTDYGYTFYDVYVYRLSMMRLLDMNDDLRDKVFSTNPARLLRLKVDA